MCPFGEWGWFPLMWIFPLIFLVVMLVFLFRGPWWATRGGRGVTELQGTAREILDRRYARGEINQEEYQRMRKDLD
jgi:putative membrane protein